MTTADQATIRETQTVPANQKTAEQLLREKEQLLKQRNDAIRAAKRRPQEIARTVWREVSDAEHLIGIGVLLLLWSLSLLNTFGCFLQVESPGADFTTHLIVFASSIVVQLILSFAQFKFWRTRWSSWSYLPQYIGLFCILVDIGTGIDGMYNILPKVVATTYFRHFWAMAFPGDDAPYLSTGRLLLFFCIIGASIVAMLPEYGLSFFHHPADIDSKGKEKK